MIEQIKLNRDTSNQTTLKDDQLAIIEQWLLEEESEEISIRTKLNQFVSSFKRENASNQETNLR